MWLDNPNRPAIQWPCLHPARSEDEQQYDEVCGWLEAKYPLLWQQSNGDPFLVIVSLSTLIEEQDLFTESDIQWLQEINQAFTGQKDAEK